jgi:hypothetical protein
MTSNTRTFFFYRPFLVKIFVLVTIFWFSLYSNSKRTWISCPSTASSIIKNRFWESLLLINFYCSSFGELWRSFSYDYTSVVLIHCLSVFLLKFRGWRLLTVATWTVFITLSTSLCDIYFTFYVALRTFVDVWTSRVRMPLIANSRILWLWQLRRIRSVILLT